MALISCVRNCCAIRFSKRLLQPAVAVALGLAIVSSSFGNLIVDSLRFDGRVRSGATVGNEAHFTNTDLLSNSFVTLPADNSALPAPLLAGFNLKAGLTEALDVYNGMSAQHAIITINTTMSIDNFDADNFHNVLDPTLPRPVNFEAVVYSNNLPAGQAIIFKGASIENGNLPPFSPALTQTITGVGNPALPLGSSGNPMKIQIGISADQIDNTISYGFAKLHLFYGSGQGVPEPMTGALMLLGLVSGLGVYRRKR